MANVRVKFQEPVYYEGHSFLADEEYSVSDETARALGSSVERVKEEKPKQEAKAAKSAPANKQVERAEKTK